MGSSIRLKKGTIINIPVILYGTPDTSVALDRYVYTNTPFFYYSQGENPAMFGVLREYADEVDALNNPYNDPSDIYNICQTLAAVGWHTKEYFYADNEGGQLIQNILDHVVWVIGDYQHGGVAMCKIANSGKYGFVAFDGIHTEYIDPEDPDPREPYVYYAFSSSAYHSGDLRGGEFSKFELLHSGMCLYTNVDATYPPIWLFYQPDYWGWGFVDGYTFDGGGVVSQYTSTWGFGTLDDAMSDSSWFKVGLLATDKLPKQPFLCQYPGSSYDRTKGYTKIADTLSREGYNRDGSIYGNSIINPYEDPFANVEDNKPAGGDAQWNKDNDDGGWTTPDQFETDAINSGFYTLYNPTKEEVQDFSDYLFTDITDSMATQLKKLIANPLDYIVFMAMCHFDVPTYNVKQPIKFCGLSSGVDSNVISQQMMSINCGSIDIVEKNQTGSFLSYSPYFKMRLFLPYIGFVDLDDKCMDSMINVMYWIDLLSGSCVAQITAKHYHSRCGSDITHNEGDTIAVYNGNVYQHLPLSATDWRGLYQGIIQFAGGAVAAIAGSPAGYGAMASAIMSSKENVQHSGSIGSNYGYIGYQKPYLILERTNLAMPVSEYGNFKGWVANIHKSLNQFKGYTEIKPDCWWNGNRTIPLNGITQEESDMLKQVFENGVYLNWEDLT